MFRVRQLTNRWAGSWKPHHKKSYWSVPVFVAIHLFRLLSLARFLSLRSPFFFLPCFLLVSSTCDFLYLLDYFFHSLSVCPSISLFSFTFTFIHAETLYVIDAHKLRKHASSLRYCSLKCVTFFLLNNLNLVSRVITLQFLTFLSWHWSHVTNCDRNSQVAFPLLTPNWMVWASKRRKRILKRVIVFIVESDSVWHKKTTLTVDTAVTVVLVLLGVAGITSFW